MKRFGSRLTNLLFAKSRILRENRESKAPCWILETWLFCRYSSFNNTSPWKVSLCINDILLLYSHKPWSSPSPLKVSLSRTMIRLLLSVRFWSDSSPWKEFLLMYEIVLFLNHKSSSETNPWNVSEPRDEILLKLKLRCTHWVRWEKTPVDMKVMELQWRLTIKASAGMSLGTPVRFWQLLRKFLVEAKYVFLQVAALGQLASTPRITTKKPEKTSNKTTGCWCPMYVWHFAPEKAVLANSGWLGRRQFEIKPSNYENNVKSFSLSRQHISYSQRQKTEASVVFIFFVGSSEFFWIFLFVFLLINLTEMLHCIQYWYPGGLWCSIEASDRQVSTPMAIFIWHCKFPCQTEESDKSESC